MDAKIGDRIKIKGNWKRGFSLYDGTISSFDIADGDTGTIIGVSTSKSAYGAWIIDLDAQPGQWVEVDKSITQPLDSITMTIDVPKPNVCTCALTNLMVEGCTCGHIKRYTPPHLREKTSASGV